MTDETPKPPLPPIKVVNVIEQDKLKTDTGYSLVNLSDAHQQQASLMAHYTTLQAAASKQLDDLELLLEATESQLFRKFRDEAILSKAKFTDEFLKRAIAGAGSVIRIKKAINEAKQIETIAKGAVKAMEQKRDMLIQAGASERQEKKGELRTFGSADQVDELKRRTLERIQNPT